MRNAATTTAEYPFPYPEYAPAGMEKGVMEFRPLAASISIFTNLLTDLSASASLYSSRVSEFPF